MFLTRKTAVERIGIWCASTLPAARRRGLLKGLTVRVACRKDGVVYAAEPGETLHAQIRVRIGGGEIDDGFLVGG